MPYYYVCVQVNVLLVTFTMIPLSHVTRVCLATSRQAEDQGNVLHVLVECLPGLGEPPNVSVSVKIYSAHMYLLHPVCERLSTCACVHACVCACVQVWGWCGECLCVCVCVCLCVCMQVWSMCILMYVCAYAHKCLYVHLDTCTSYIDQIILLHM